MYLMSYEILIGNNPGLAMVETVMINRSVDNLGDVATITLPGQFLNKGLRIEDRVKRGDAVTIRLGYDGQVIDEFKGYIRTVSPNTPFSLECEDSIFLMRRAVIDKVWKKTTVPDILRWLVGEVNKSLTGKDKFTFVTDIKGYQYDKFTVHKATAYEVLTKLKSDTALNIYCWGNELHCHFGYTERRGEAKYDFAGNIEDTDALEYIRADSSKVLVKVIGKTKKGAAIDVTEGTQHGDVITIRLPFVSDKTTLEKIAKENVAKYSYDGYRGSIVAWGIPFVEPGYTARITDKDYPEREGRYYVKGVRTDFSASTGFRRTVELAIKL